MTTDCRWLAKTAVAAGKLSSADALALPSANLSEAWEAVCSAAGISPSELAELVAHRYGLPLADLSTIEASAAEHVPLKVLQNRDLRVLRLTSSGLHVATADPTDRECLRLLQFAADVPVRLCIAAPQQLAALRPEPAPDEAEDESDLPSAGGVLQVGASQHSQSAIVRLGDQMLQQAVELGASDIHIQPQGKGGVIRMRIDGVMRRVATLPRPVLLSLISRTKLLGSMDPTDRLRPQDGRLRLQIGEVGLDLRLSTVPANGAEKLVIRLLGAGKTRTLRELGLPQRELDQLGTLLSRSHGLVLLCGPTGSGKTTTLYGGLAERNEPGVNIATVEDPVEIRLPRLTQIEVNAKAELTFASALRSVLRQDPDIVLIGEIRDKETAQIAVQAALTGHLVLASLHCNDAITALPRLLDLGVGHQLLAEVLAGAASQRLVRRLCPACSVPTTTETAATAWLADHAGVSGLREAVGCPECGFSGYKGRLTLCQVLTFTPELAEQFEAGAPLARLRALARQQGMRVLAESALDRLRAGETSLDEVLRNLGTEFWPDTALALGVPPFQQPYVPRGKVAIEEVPVLVICRDAELRRRAADALTKAGHVPMEAENAAAGRELLVRAGGAQAILVDFTGLQPARIKALLGVRDTLGGAAIPIMGLRGKNSPSIDALLDSEPGVILRHKPDTDEALAALIAEAIRALD